MKGFLIIIGILAIFSILCYLYAICLDDMSEKYPDYKGEDFLNDKYDN